MARVRSPNYPSLSLPDAIARIKQIHTSQGHLPEPREVVAKHMGYGSLNGSALKSLSSLIKYDLLEEETKGELKVSETALDILFSDGAAEKAKAISHAAKSPALFSEIFDRWQGSKPSDESLRSYLVRRQFALSAIDAVIKNFGETFDLVARESEGYDSSQVEDEGDQMLQTADTAPVHPAPPKPSATAVPLDEPFEISIAGKRISGRFEFRDQESIEQLIGILNANKIMLPAKAKGEESH